MKYTYSYTIHYSLKTVSNNRFTTHYYKVDASDESEAVASLFESVEDELSYRLLTITSVSKK